MAYSNPQRKPSLMLFSFLALLLLCISDSVLGSSHHNGFGHHKRKHAQAPAPALVVATPLVPTEGTPSTPALVQAPSSEVDLAPVEGPTQDCSPYASGLLDCLDYLTTGNTVAKPGGSCCSDLRDIAKEDVSCLCALLLGNEDDFGFQINTSRIFSLPYTCSFSLPTLNKCSALGSTTVVAVPGPSQGSSDIASPPLALKSFAMALPITVFTIATGIVVSMLSLIA